MGKKVEFYYDFSSPYTYIASTRIEKICRDNGAELEWKPFLLGGLFNDTGVKPAIEINNKFAYIKQDTEDSAKHYGVQFRFPAIFPLNSVKAMRGAFAASEKGKLAEYNHELFRLFWTEGRDLSKDDVLKEAVAGVGLDPEWFIARIAEQDIKDRLREETSKAAAPEYREWVRRAQQTWDRWPDSRSVSAARCSTRYTLQRTFPKPSMIATLAAAARIMAERPYVQLVIAGHSDPPGSDDTNHRLSLARAEAVRAFLVGDAAFFRQRFEEPDPLTAWEWEEIQWMLHGVRGGLIAGLLFVLPGAGIVFALSWLYVLHGQAPIIAALFYGVKAGVLAFVADAVVRIGRRALKSWTDLAVALAAFLALYVFGTPFPLVILAALALGAFTARPVRSELLPEPQAQPSARKALSVALLWSVAWLAPLLVVIAAFGPRHVLSEIGVIFSQLALVTFGGAYAMLAYLQQQAVDVHGWLDAGQMIDGLGLAETTPGPLVLVNQYVGFLAGWRDGGLALAASAAALATWCTIAPSFVWIFAGAPFAERLRTNELTQGALRTVTAAILGIIASLSLWFAQHVVFQARVALSTPWGRPLDLPIISSFDPFAALIAAFAALALIRFKANAALVVLACALAGWIGSAL